MTLLGSASLQAILGASYGVTTIETGTEADNGPREFFDLEGNRYTVLRSDNASTIEETTLSASVGVRYVLTTLSNGLRPFVLAETGRSFLLSVRSVGMVDDASYERDRRHEADAARWLSIGVGAVGRIGDSLQMTLEGGVRRGAIASIDTGGLSDRETRYRSLGTYTMLRAFLTF
jgi:hypothetical protein